MSFAQPVFLVALALVPLGARRVRALRARAPPRRATRSPSPAVRASVGAEHAGLAPPRAARGLRARARRPARRARQAADDGRRPGRARVDHARRPTTPARCRRPTSRRPGCRPRAPRPTASSTRCPTPCASALVSFNHAARLVSSPTIDRAPLRAGDRDAEAQRRHRDRRGAGASR